MTSIIQCLPLFCLVIALTTSNVFGNSTNCDISVEKMDNYFKEALFIKQGAEFPTNDQEIDDYCRNGKLFLNEVKNFNQCSKPFPRQVIQIIGKSLSKTMKFICKQGKPRQKLAKAFECATSSYHKTVQDCGLIMVNQIYLSSLNMTSEQLFPLICCSFHSLRECILAAPVPLCSDEKLNLTSYFMIQIDKLLKDFIDLLCGRWATLPQCQENAPEVFAHLAKLSNVSIFNKDESLLGTILSITTKLSDE